MTDFQLVLVRGAFIHDQLRHRLHPEEACTHVSQALDEPFPYGLPAQHALLQDLQLGQPYCESGPEIDARRREVVIQSFLPLHQPGEASARHDPLLEEAERACRVGGTSPDLRLVCLLRLHHSFDLPGIWPPYSSRAKT